LNWDRRGHLSPSRRAFPFGPTCAALYATPPDSAQGRKNEELENSAQNLTGNRDVNRERKTKPRENEGAR
jgi:hypothetical protein